MEYGALLTSLLQAVILVVVLLRRFRVDYRYGIDGFPVLQA